MRRHEVRAHAPELATVLQQAYDLAVLERSQRPYLKRYSAAGPQISSSALDLRLPLSRTELLRPIALNMGKALTENGYTQVAGYGYGAFALIGAITALAAPGLNGALIRESAKPYGFCRRVEGDLDVLRQVIVVDDLLKTGDSALRAAAALRQEGYLVTGVFTVFRFAGPRGRTALHRAGLGHRCLATLRRIPPPYIE
jgi:orotate phosphoribosyltransferase